MTVKNDSALLQQNQPPTTTEPTDRECTCLVPSPGATRAWATLDSLDRDRGGGGGRYQVTVCLATSCVWFAGLNSVMISLHH